MTIWETLSDMFLHYKLWLRCNSVLRHFKISIRYPRNRPVVYKLDLVYYSKIANWRLHPDTGIKTQLSGALSGLPYSTKEKTVAASTIRVKAALSRSL